MQWFHELRMNYLLLKSVQIFTIVNALLANKPILTLPIWYMHGLFFWICQRDNEIVIFSRYIEMHSSMHLVLVLLKAHCVDDKWHQSIFKVSKWLSSQKWWKKLLYLLYNYWWMRIMNSQKRESTVFCHLSLVMLVPLFLLPFAHREWFEWIFLLHDLTIKINCNNAGGDEGLWNAFQFCKKKYSEYSTFENASCCNYNWRK